MILTKMMVLRRQKEWTQFDLGQKCSPPLPQSTISNIEIGRKVPALVTHLKNIARTLGYEGEPTELQEPWEGEQEDET